MRKISKSFLKTLKNEKGSMLVLSLLVAALFITLSTSYLGLMVVESRNTERAYRSNLALHLAESGVEEAIWQLKHNNKAFSGWTGSNPKAKTATLSTVSGENLGSYTVIVTDPDGTTPVISSIGSALYQSSTLAEQRTVKVGLENDSESYFNMAAYAIEDVELGAGAGTDSYNSGVDDYDPSNPGSNGDVGTSSTNSLAINLDATAFVDGDGIVGVSGDPDTVMPSDDLSGTKQAQTTAWTPPAVDPPSDLTDLGALSVSGTEPIDASAQYSSITLEKDSSITIDQDTDIYVTGEIYFKKNSHIDITNNASVRIFLDGGLKWNKDGQINNVSQDPTKLIIYGTSNYDDSDTVEGDGGGTVGGILVKKNTTFYGAIYAPNASITVEKDSQIYGALVGKNVTLGMNTKLHYDEALADLNSGGSSDYTVSYWQEK